MPAPSQPEQWVGTNVAAVVAGETLIICHPDLKSAPADCTPADQRYASGFGAKLNSD